MSLLATGLALWSVFHLFHRLWPARRSRIEQRMGQGPAKGLMAAGIGLGLIFMVIGVRGAEFVPVYTPPPWTVHLNNLLMLVAVGLFGMGHSRGRAKTWFRHPMLLSVIVWAVAHLLVNGDLASIVLFGVLAAWAIASILIINAQDGPWERPAPGPVKSDIRLVIITLVVFGVVAMIHAWLGYWPFPG